MGNLASSGKVYFGPHRFPQEAKAHLYWLWGGTAEAVPFPIEFGEMF